MMLNNSQDHSLDDYFTKFQTLIEIQRKDNVSDHDLQTLNGVLIDELEVYKERLKNNESLIENLTEICQESSSLQYVEIQEKQKQLEGANRQLKEEIENLKMSFIEEKMNLNQQHVDELKKLQEEQKLNTVKAHSDLKFMREEFQTRERELYNEIQGLQAASAMQCDELESKLMQQIMDLNTKLRDANSSRTNLQSEIHNLRAQYNICVNNNEKKNSELQMKLKMTEKHLKEAQMKLETLHLKSKNSNYNLADVNEYLEADEVEFLSNVQNTCNRTINRGNNNTNNNNQSSNLEKTLNNFSNEGAKVRDNKSTKYPPLEVTSKGKDIDAFYDVDDDATDFEKAGLSLPSKKTLPTVYKGKGRGHEQIWRGKTTSKIGYLPPLRQCSDTSNPQDSNTEKERPKKRKLFNPNDLDYLDNL